MRFKYYKYYNLSKYVYEKRQHMQKALEPNDLLKNPWKKLDLYNQSC